MKITTRWLRPPGLWVRLQMLTAKTTTDSLLGNTHAVSGAGKAKPQNIWFAVRDIPIENFGNKHGRQTRKFVLFTIASFANPNGSNCFPSVERLARDCGLSERGLQKVLTWLKDSRLLEIRYKEGPNGANVFIIHLGVVNSSVHHERQRSSRTEAQRVVNGSATDSERSDTDSELQSSPDLQDLQEDLQITSKGPIEEFVLPSWIPSEEWKDFEKMRRTIRKPMTDEARNLIIADLERLRHQGESIPLVLQKSIACSYPGVYEIKHGKPFQERTSQEKKKKQRDPNADLRHKPFIGALETYWNFMFREDENPPTMPFSPCTAKVLHEFLQANPKLTLDQFKQCLINRAHSEGVVPSDDPVFWIRSLMKYYAGPLDRFGKLKEEPDSD